MNEKPKHAGGHPPIEINLKTVEGLAMIQCTQEEMAAVLGISVDTIERRMKDDPEFSGIIKKGKANGKMSLRRKMYDGAMSGNVTMQIWLSKQYLDMVDKQEYGGKDGANLMVQLILMDKKHDKGSVEN